jgi:addiction module HigA family antidote
MTTQPFNPNYSQPPGAYLEDVLDQRGIRKADFATRCGRPAKTISEIIAGKAAITPDTALQFERVLDISALLWLSWEANHQLHAARERERQGLAAGVAWARRFPHREMQSKGFIPATQDPVDLVEKILNFFGVSSVAAWEEYWEQRVAAARFKKAARSEQNGYAVAAWLRFGDVTAAAIECEPYSETRFKEALKKLRALTRHQWPLFRDELVSTLAAAGVAVAFIPDLHNLGLRGAAYWATKDKAVIILSDRLKEESRFWFALFHEAMHILLHSKKALFIDYVTNGEDGSQEEREADEHAANTLIPTDAVNRFMDRYGRVPDSYSANALSTFSREIDIDPSLLLARLQREGLISWKSTLNKQFRRRMEF